MNSYFDQYPDSSLYPVQQPVNFDAQNSQAKLEASLRRQQEEAAELLRQQQGQGTQQGQEQDGGIDPMQAYDMYNKFSGAGAAGSTVGGSAAPVSGSMSGVGAAANSSAATLPGYLGGGAYPATGLGGTAAGSSAAGAAPATGAAGASSGMGSTVMAAAPWAALAAAVIANESKQRGDGNRGNSTGEHIGDLVSGKVLERDAERYLAHNKAGGAVKRSLMMSTPSGIVRNAKDLGRWTKGLFD